MRRKVVGPAILLSFCLGAVAWGQTSDLAEANRLEEQLLQLDKQGKYAEAARLGEQVLTLREKTLGPEHPDTAQSLNNLANMYARMGDYEKAVSFHQRALAIREKVPGPEHPDTAASLSNLATVRLNMGEYEKAAPLFQRALAIREKVLGSEHPDTAQSLGSLANVYNDIGDYEKAVSFHQRALAIQERVLGSEHPDTAASLSNLATVHLNMGEYEKAALLFQRALAIREKVLGPEHPDTAVSLSNLAVMYDKMGEYEKAALLFQRALAIREKVLGSEHPDTAVSLSNLATVYYQMGDYEKALRFSKQALSAEDRTFANIFAVASEEQKLRFAQKSQGTYLATLALLQRRFATDGPSVRWGLEMVWRRKGIVLDAQSRAQQTLATHLQGETLQAWQRLTQLRSDLSHLLLGGLEKQPPTAYRRAIDELQASVDQEEEFLAQHSGVAAQALVQQQVTVHLLTEHLPKEGALIEFVRIRDMNENCLCWVDTYRYLAFVLTSDEQVTFID